MRQIPILLATDNNYKYALIALISISKHASPNTFYNIYFLVDKEFKKESENHIRECVKNECKACKVEFIEVSDIFENIQMRITRITRPTYYRLLASELLNEDKCIYLDTDVVVLTDLCELYNTDIEDYYIGGVKAPSYLIMEHSSEYCKQAMLPDLNQYVNAGVLLLNLKKMREDNLTKRFLPLLELNMEGQDQDIINSVCYDNIYFLPFTYNVMTKYAAWFIKDYQNLIPESELIDAWNNPKIIHYADKIKPWTNLDCYLGEYWWDICKNSSMWKCFYNDMQEDFFGKAIYKTRNSGFAAKKVPKLFDLSFERKYVVYGAGPRAKDVLEYLAEQGIIPEFIIVSKLGDNPIEINGIPVYGIKEMRDKLEDKSILIATRELYHNEIIACLASYNYHEIIPVADEFRLEKEKEEC